MKKRFKTGLIGILMLLIIGLSIGLEAKSTQNPSEARNIIDFLKKNKKDYSTLDQALEAAGLTQTLEGEGPFTIFVPTNRAFEQLPKGALEKLLAPQNKAQLTDVLTYHVTKGTLSADALTKSNGQTITMLNGKPAKIEVKDGKVYIDGAKVLRADLPVGNGVIHVIDTVLTPQ